MASAASLRDALTRLAETLIIGAASGAALGLAHFPAGWLSGAIIAVAAALLRPPMLVPNGGVTGGDSATLAPTPKSAGPRTAGRSPTFDSRLPSHGATRQPASAASALNGTAS